MHAKTPPFGALDGLTVIDVTVMLAGPYASMMLADQGARVIKIEPPGGEDARRVGPYLGGALPPEQGGYGAYFASINRNKDSVVIDLKQEAGKDVLRRLAAKADVLIDNYRGGVMERLGLSYESLAEANPRLVYAALRGFGDRRSGESPYAAWPAYDPVSQAMGGIMGITGATAGGPPTKIGPGVGDIMPAMFLAFGIAAACWRAQRTGRGQFLDIAMVDGVLAVCERIVFQYSATGIAPKPEGSGHPLLCPFGLFPAKDGFVSLGIPKDEFWAPFVRLMDRPELAGDPRYATNAARLERRDEVNALIGAWTAARTKAELAAAFGGKIPFGPVLQADDIFADPHFAARTMLAEVEMPGADRPLTVANTPLRLSETPGGVRRRAPLTGEDTDKVLAEFGFDTGEIARLRESGAVG
ncbi:MULTISPECIES: CoA transferase [Rhodomicrobium]|uniref:CaiB/BaiF CoA transferase family protein n=1 Tax=Rhodomicrobium TaxID=1068 RepID=UPI000B4B752D|nr:MULTISPECIES: CoA transferase [Rhodomicrobium]